MISPIVNRTSFRIAIQIKKMQPTDYYTTKRGELETNACDEKNELELAQMPSVN